MAEQREERGMTSEQFVYWLQGYVEMGGDTPNPEQWQMIKDHLALVFDKQTPQLPPRFDPKPTIPPATPDASRRYCVDFPWDPRSKGVC